MHYAPESPREFLPEAGASSAGRAESFHYRSAPIYLLTAVVGAVLLADVALGLVWGTSSGTPPIAPNADWWTKLLTTRSFFGFRLALLAAVLGVDTCPMEGIAPVEYDRILGLTGSGYKTVVACAAGYRHAEDKYAVTPKVRFRAEEVLVRV